MRSRRRLNLLGLLSAVPEKSGLVREGVIIINGSREERYSVKRWAASVMPIENAAATDALINWCIALILTMNLPVNPYDEPAVPTVGKKR